MTAETPTNKACATGTCPPGGCPLITPFGLATFLVGFMVVFYAPWPYQLIGYLTVAAGYLNGLRLYLSRR